MRLQNYFPSDTLQIPSLALEYTHNNEDGTFMSMKSNVLSPQNTE